MASAPPLPTEFHRLVIVLDGARLKGRPADRAVRYFEYMAKIRKLAEEEFGATVHAPELHLKQGTINARKRTLKKRRKRR
jgi:hypothetical protein